MRVCTHPWPKWPYSDAPPYPYLSYERVQSRGGSRPSRSGGTAESSQPGPGVAHARGTGGRAEAALRTSQSSLRGLRRRRARSVARAPPRQASTAATSSAVRAPVLRVADRLTISQARPRRGVLQRIASGVLALLALGRQQPVVDTLQPTAARCVSTCGTCVGGGRDVVVAGTTRAVCGGTSSRRTLRARRTVTQRRLGADQRPGDVEAVLGQQIGQVVAGDSARDVGVALPDRVAVPVAQARAAPGRSRRGRPPAGRSAHTRRRLVGPTHDAGSPS